MSILHTVNKSSFTHNTLKSCLTTCTQHDSILFIEDGVFGVLPSAPSIDALEKLSMQGTKIYALSRDVNARGLTQKISEFVQLIDYDEFVKLTVNHKCVQSWY